MEILTYQIDVDWFPQILVEETLRNLDWRRRPMPRHRPRRWTEYREGADRERSMEACEPSRRSWPKALKNHLVRVSGRASALLGAANRPSQHRPAKHVTGQQRRRGRQVHHPIGQELQAGGDRLPEV